MHSDNSLGEVQNLAELLYSVRSKGDKARPSGAGLDPLHPIIGGGVTPQQVHEHHASIFHGQRSLQVVYLLYSHDGPPNACTPPQPKVRSQHGSVAWTACHMAVKLCVVTCDYLWNSWFLRCCTCVYSCLGYILSQV